MRFLYPKSARILTRRHYQRFSQQSKRFIGNGILLEVRRCSGTATKLGITVSKRYGNAVLRNRFKRIVREAFRLSLPQLPQGIDLNVKPYGNIYTLTSSAVILELLQLLEKYKTV